MAISSVGELAEAPTRSSRLHCGSNFVSFQQHPVRSSGWSIPTGVRLALAVLGFLLQSYVCLARDAVDVDRDSARRGSNGVWYDSAKGEVRYPESQLRTNDVSDRHDSLASPRSTSFWRRWFGDWGSNSNGNGPWSGLTDFFELLLKAWRILLVVLLGLIVFATIYILARIGIVPGFNKAAKSLPRGEDLEQQRAKISDLPFEMEQPIGGLRAQAERLRAQGDCSKAMLYLFSYLLVELDSRQCIRLERGKTNGAYLRDLRTRPWLQNYMQRSAGSFEWVYFGRHSLDAEAFDALWNQLPTFESQIALPPVEGDAARFGRLEALTGARA